MKFNYNASFVSSGVSDLPNAKMGKPLSSALSKREQENNFHYNQLLKVPRSRNISVAC